MVSTFRVDLNQNCVVFRLWLSLQVCMSARTMNMYSHTCMRVCELYDANKQYFYTSHDVSIM